MNKNETLVLDGHRSGKQVLGLKAILFVLIYLQILLPSTLAATYNIGPGGDYETFAAFHAAITAQSGDIVDGGGNVFYERVAMNGPATYRNFILDGTLSFDGLWTYEADSSTYSETQAWTQLGETEIYYKVCGRNLIQFFEDGTLLTPRVCANEAAVIANLVRGEYSWLDGGGANDRFYYCASDGGTPATHTLRGSNRTIESGGAIGLLYGESLDGLVLSDITVRYHATNAADYGGLILSGCINWAVSHFTSTYNITGVNLMGCSNGTLDGTITYNSNAGLIIQNDSNNLVITGTFDSNGAVKKYTTTGTSYGYLGDGDNIGIGGDGGTITKIQIGSWIGSRTVISNAGSPESDATDRGCGVYVGTANPMTAQVDIVRCDIYGNHTSGVNLGPTWLGGTVACNIIRDNQNYTGNRNALHLNITNATQNSYVLNNILAFNHGKSAMYIVGVDDNLNYAISVQNNLYYNNGRAVDFNGDLWLQDADISRLTEDHNLYYRTGTDWDAEEMINKNGTLYHSDDLGLWQATGHGTGDSFTSDPLFIEPTGGNFHTSKGPGVGTGADICSTVTDMADYDGHVVCSGGAAVHLWSDGVDIGARAFEGGRALLGP